MLKQLKITLNWWQAAVYELAVLALGIMIGTHWPEIFNRHFLLLGLIFIATGSYIIGLWLNQNRSVVDK